MNLKEMMMNYLREEGFCPKEEDFGLISSAKDELSFSSTMTMTISISV